MAAVLASLLFYLTLVALIAGVVAFFASPPGLKRGSAHVLVAILVACCLSWALAYLMRRRALCPLCKSTPFLDNHAVKHEKARRFGPLNHGTTAILSVLLRQCWCCMYCGTSFDLLKRKRKG